MDSENPRASDPLEESTFGSVNGVNDDNEVTQGEFNCFAEPHWLTANAGGDDEDGSCLKRTFGLDSNITFLDP